MYGVWENKRACPEKEVVINNVKCCLEIKQDKDREESTGLCDMEPISEPQLEGGREEKLELREQRQYEWKNDLINCQIVRKECHR